MTKRNIPSLEKRKEQYDLFLKDFENRPEAFRDDYPVYFKDIESAGISDMSKKDKEAYNSGAGGELKERNINGKKFPPSMLSVASSSRFCYLSLVNSDLSVFGIRKGSSRIKFEEKLPILDRGIPPHMDACLEIEDKLYFFECKCHELFDCHSIVLAESYFKKNLIVDRIFANKEYKDKVKKYDDGNETHYRQYSPTILGVNENPRFDIKQLITHIMGIQNKLRSANTNSAELIYYYFIPKDVKDNKQIKEVIDELENEIKVIFAKIKDFIPEITLRFYVQYSKVVETAGEDNTESRL